MQKPYVSMVNGRFALLRLAHDDPGVRAADEVTTMNRALILNHTGISRAIDNH
jgi:hypothetical protein